MRSNLSDQPQGIQELIEKFPTAKSVTEAKEMELLLDQYLRGDMSVLSDPSKAALLERVMSNANAADVAMKESDGKLTGTIEDVFYQAEKQKPTGDELEREKMRGMKIMESALREARAKKSTKQQWLEWQIEYGPKETIAVAGRPEMIKTGEHGGTTMKIRPEVINIMGTKFVLAPGVQEVPWVVAVQYRESMKGKYELQAREHIMRSQGHMGQLEAGYSRIDDEFGTEHQSLVNY